MVSLVSERFIADLHYLASLRFCFDIFVLRGKDQAQIGVIGEWVSSGWPTYSLLALVGPARQLFALAVFTRARQSLTEIPHCHERELVVRPEYLLVNPKQ